METTLTLANVNKVNILLIENGEKLVPIKPICEALNIDAKNQREKISQDEILGSVGVLSTSVGADGKTREMFCIPFKYVFGWLFTINPKNVKPEAQQAVIRYKMDWYNALYNYFTERAEFIDQRDKAMLERIAELEKIKEEFHTAKGRLDNAKEQLKAIADLTFEQWKAEKMQLTINFDANDTGRN